jgi:hypothetical protein
MRILFLTTWFPYPPVPGGKIRAFNLLKALASRHQVVLLSFQDAPIEPQWLEEMKKICEKVEIVDRDPFYKDPRKGKTGFFSLLPRNVVAYYSQEMEDAARRVAQEWQPDVVVALTLMTARYALNVDGALRVVDVDNLMTRLLEDAYQQAKSALERLRRRLAWWKM